MKRTAAVTLVIFGIAGAVAGFLADLVLTSTGRPTFQPSVMLPILLVALGVSCVLFAYPIRRAVTNPRAPRVDPFRAVRIAVLAKASSLVGCLTGGAAVGLLVFQATRPVVPGLGSMSTVIATAIGGVVLVILGLIAEHLCTLPKDPDEREPDAAEPGTEPEF
ncbi:DUF3180 domain-containing protein [Microbacterium sp. G2-8]|uniref:DUF3180 domain-containing protein n=1 Tax=Microbacterium sp. G2-8 TaxID=2842454 RepID=UPI001C8B0212|nr:DUF3180 domain-containing protein [Microbacterium sp. G2-8]